MILVILKFKLFKNFRITRKQHFYSIFIYTLFFSSACYSISIIDDDNHHITLIHPATRIISLAPDITEILFAISAQDKIIATIKESDYPQAAKQIERIGAYGRIDMEKILMLKPDLIITWGNAFSKELMIFEKLGIPIYHTKTTKLIDIAHTMRQFGILTANQLNASQASNHFLNKLTTLTRHDEKKHDIKVFFQIGSYSLLTINKDSWINEAIERCGGKNIFANLRFMSQSLSLESVIHLNPEIIIVDTTDTNWKSNWLMFPKMVAIKQQKLYRIDPDLIERASPRVLKGVAKICQYLSLNKVNEKMT